MNHTLLTPPREGLRPARNETSLNPAALASMPRQNRSGCVRAMRYAHRPSPVPTSIPTSRNFDAASRTCSAGTGVHTLPRTNSTIASMTSPPCGMVGPAERRGGARAAYRAPRTTLVGGEEGETRSRANRERGANLRGYDQRQPKRFMSIPVYSRRAVSQETGPGHTRALLRLSSQFLSSAQCQHIHWPDLPI